MLTAEQVRHVLDYNPDTGVFHWTDNASYQARCREIGTKNNGYVVIRVNNKRYKAHRLAWLYVHGKWPDNDIDHINGVRDDNRISNLRDVSRSVNSQNERKARPNNKSCGLLGATWHKRTKRWRAQICIQGKKKHLGYYKTPEQAHAAYLEAKRQQHEGCTI